jgi:hypothetical protein
MTPNRASGPTPVIKRTQARIVTDVPPYSGPAPRAHVQIERSTESTTEIRVTCPCGHATVVVCEHPPAPAGGQAGGRP